jgi:hypothetical protein
VDGYWGTCGCTSPLRRLWRAIPAPPPPPITAPGPVLRLADTADAWTRWDLSDAICSMQAASMQSAACRLHHAISQPSREMWKA